jgi:hypothetical protein
MGETQLQRSERRQQQTMNNSICDDKFLLFFYCIFSAPSFLTCVERERERKQKQASLFFPFNIFFLRFFSSLQLEKAEKIAKHIKELFTGELFPKVVICFLSSLLPSVPFVIIPAYSPLQTRVVICEA